MLKLILITFSFVPLTVHAYDFKGIQLGQPESAASIKEKIGIKCSPGKDPFKLICTGTTTIAKASAFANIVVGQSGVVQRIFLTFDSSNFNDVESALNEKFGQPSSTDNSTVQNRMGVSFQQVMHQWNDGANHIVFRRYGSKITKSSLIFFTDDDMELIKQINEENKTDI